MDLPLQTSLQSNSNWEVDKGLACFKYFIASCHRSVLDKIDAYPNYSLRTTFLVDLEGTGRYALYAIHHLQICYNAFQKVFVIFITSSTKTCISSKTKCPWLLEKWN